MKTYRITDLIMLGFATPQDQYHAYYKPSPSLTLECDGSTIWLCTPNERLETITGAHAIDVWVNTGRIAEI
jgi:hypothetical protein